MSGSRERNYDHVTREIAQGAAPRPDRLYPPELAIGRRFQLVVLCAMEYQETHVRPGDFGRKTRILYVPLNDDGTPPTPSHVKSALRAGAEVAAAALRGEHVLVTCRMGRNRSGLVTGLALLEAGWRADYAIARIQRVRKDALTNAYFLRLLELQGASLAERRRVG